MLLIAFLTKLKGKWFAAQIPGKSTDFSTLDRSRGGRLTRLTTSTPYMAEGESGEWRVARKRGFEGVRERKKWLDPVHGQGGEGLIGPLAKARVRITSPTGR